MKIKNFKSLYEELSKEIFCLSLNQNIKITSSGFRHVFKQKIRKKEEMENRADCIKYIPKLIKTINLYQSHEKQINVDGDREFWNIQGVIDGICLHVTIRRIGSQDLHLYSWHYKGLSPKIVK